MSRIAENLQNLYRELGSVRLIVVSKYRRVEEIREVYDAGHREFAENRVQALMERKEALPSDIKWHLIGHLQTNKVKYIAPFISMIHSVDSLKLLQEIDRQAEKNNRVIDCLLQVFVADEDTKFGLLPEEIPAILESAEFAELRHIRICGLMAMATNTDDLEKISSEFSSVQKLHLDLKNRFFKGQDHFRELSIGMSSDYALAVKYGSTMVRIGSKVFEP